MNKFALIVLLFAFFSVNGQIYTGKIVDVNTKQPIAGAEVILQGTTIKSITNALGEFNISTDIPDNDAKSKFKISIISGVLSWETENEIYLQLLNIIGQNIGFDRKLGKGSGAINLPDLSGGIYLLSVAVNGTKKTYKINSSCNFNLAQESSEVTGLKSANTVSDTLVITKDGYYDQKYACKEAGYVYGLLKLQYDDVDYFEELPRPEAFNLLEDLPLTPRFGEVKSIKLVYSIPDGKLYYTNSKKYLLHYDFAAKVLTYPKSQSVFNQEQYTQNPNRLYFLATLNHFTSSDIYTLDFLPMDEADCDNIELVYNKVVETSFIGDKLKFYASAAKWSTCSNIPIITSDELYKGQNYQPLNTQENYGYLKKLTTDELTGTYLSRHDIVLLNGIPIDISVVAGIITTEFQTPLSHINVLSHNRGTPNMALRDGWTNPKVNDFINKLVYFKVTLDSFYIREADLAEAQQFWSTREPQDPHVLDLDTLTDGIIDLTKADVSWVKTIGGKAANFAELTKINVEGYGALPLPEGKFAIPFSYYWKHIKKYGLDKYIDEMLKDSAFWKDISVRQAKLEILQDSIKHCELDTCLIRLVKEKLNSVDGYKTFRFRSSTNAEDIVGFNGAGLYDSYTGSLTDPDKPIDKAIKKTWASLWVFKAFEEREYFKIDQRSVAMGILINRSFPSEVANGVVITENVFNQNIPAITINVQVGEISIVKPTENYLPDQVIYYTLNENTFEYVNHSNVPGMEGKTVMTDEELKVLKDYCMSIHYHYWALNLESHPMDIEFKIDIVNGERKIYIKQARRY